MVAQLVRTLYKPAAVFLALYAVSALAALGLGPLSNLPRQLWVLLPVDFTENFMPSRKPPVFLFVSSNLQLIMPDRLQYDLPKQAVRMIYIGGIRIEAEISKITKSLVGWGNKELRSKGVVVIGAWYGAFSPFPSNYIPDLTAADWLATPFEATKLYYFGTRNWLFSKNAKLLKKDALPPLADDVTPLSTENKDPARVSGYGSEITEKSFSELLDIVGQLREAGYKVLVVEPPIPQLHQQLAKPLNDAYHRHMQETLPKLEGQGFKFLDLSAMDDNADFRDLTHPQPSAAERWRIKIVEAIRELEGG